MEKERELRVYLGQTRDRRLIAHLSRLGFGECTTRGELPPRRRPWFYDNGAFSDWRAERPFDAVQFDRDLRCISYWRLPPPDFIVLPDIVGAGVESLSFSLSYLDGLMSPFHGYPAPVYLAVQDGMTEELVSPLLPKLAGLFVGGTLEWKLLTAATWVRFAHEHGLRCHLGRCGTPARVRWAKRIGADSIDSALPLWSEQNLARFVGALGSGKQISLALA